MQSLSRGIGHRLKSIGLTMSFGLGLLLSAADAQAQIVETATITNFYQYSFDQLDLGSEIGVTGSASVRKDHVTADGLVSQFGLDLVGTLDGGDFYFLHNLYCVGTCSVRSYTQIVFTLENIGTEAVNLRFDSLITPGHLGETGVDGASAGQFGFQVVQSGPTGQSELYYASGSTGYGDIRIENATGLDFNGHDRQGSDETWQTLDWSATNLNVMLNTINPGETHTLTYTSAVLVESFADCSNIANCLGGLQVAFGDPRTTGSIGSRMAGPAALSASGEPIIGRSYLPYESYARFVEVTDPNNPPPLPGTPDAYPPVDYTRLFSPATPLPEPASWAMMIAGFAAIGGSLRGREFRFA